MKSTLNINQLHVLSEVIRSKQRLRYLFWHQTALEVRSFTKNTKAPREQLALVCTHNVYIYSPEQIRHNSNTFLFVNFLLSIISLENVGFASIVYYCI